MLILTRKENESIVIQAGGETIVVRLIRIEGSRARVGIEADERVSIMREELGEKRQRKE
jgi:carbon storage regulator CsrA